MGDGRWEIEDWRSKIGDERFGDGIKKKPGRPPGRRRVSQVAERPSESSQTRSVWTQFKNENSSRQGRWYQPQ